MKSNGWIEALASLKKANETLIGDNEKLKKQIKTAQENVILFSEWVEKNRFKGKEEASMLRIYPDEETARKNAVKFSPVK